MSHQSASPHPIHVYLIASTPYGFLHHRFQKLADTFRASGIPVTYIEQTHGWQAYLSGKRLPLFRATVRSGAYHLLAILSMAFPFIHRTSKSHVHVRALPDWEILEMPLVIPSNKVNSSVVEKLNTAVFRRVLRRHILNRKAPSVRSVAIVDHPLMGCALEKGDFDRIYYDCIDHLSLYAGHASLRRFGQYEDDLIAKSDGVFVTAEKLEEHLRTRNQGRPVYKIPNGVDAAWFRRRVQDGSAPFDVRDVPRPIVGYIGTHSTWLDYTLVGRVALLMPDVSFLFVGPLDMPSRKDQLCSQPNIFWLGRRDYCEVPLYTQAFDVCWIPFVAGKITENTNPIKLFEYFALGKPVVTTPMHEVEPYVKGGLAHIGRTAQEIVAAIRSTLRDDDQHRVRERMRVADDHSWSALAEKMKGVMMGDHV